MMAGPRARARPPWRLRPPANGGCSDARRNDRRALRSLNDSYVFPDVARKMVGAVRTRQRRNEYDAITTPAYLLTRSQRICARSATIFTLSLAARYGMRTADFVAM